jgi:hypothetical protein
MNHPERSQPFVIQLDRESAPGKVICHFVRFETVVFDDTDELPNIAFVRIDEELDVRAILLRLTYGKLFLAHPELMERPKQ